MNVNQLAKEITKHEGLKVQVNIAQVKEILRVLAVILVTDWAPLKCFIGYLFEKVEGEE